MTMTIHHRENYATAKKDDIDATVSEILGTLNMPAIDAFTVSNLKANLKRVLDHFYDRAAEEGRYLEIMDPSNVS